MKIKKYAVVMVSTSGYFLEKFLNSGWIIDRVDGNVYVLYRMEKDFKSEQL